MRVEQGSTGPDGVQTGACCESGALVPRFFLPPEAMRPFVTTFYHFEVADSHSGGVEDWIPPEWPGLRISPSAPIDAVIGEGELVRVPALVASGPTSKATRYRIGKGRTWGIGLLPLGWARLVDGSVADFADGFFDAATHPAMQRLRPLGHAISALSGDLEAEVETLIALMAEALSQPADREAQIARFTHHLVDPALRTVSELGDRMGMSPRTLERFSRSAIGFTPRVLLQRQRFLRSLAQFMLDPSMKWIDTLDSHHHDQAHFIRDFKKFMGISPSEYAQMPHPVMTSAAQARRAIAGEGVQGLHKVQELGR